LLGFKLGRVNFNKSWSSLFLILGKAIKLNLATPFTTLTTTEP